MPTTVVIPTPADVANFDQSVELNGTVFIFQFRYNGREGSWYFDLLDESGTMLRAGIRMVPNYALLQSYVGEARPLGELVLSDARLYSDAPSLDELENLVRFLYVGA